MAKKGKSVVNKKKIVDTKSLLSVKEIESIKSSILESPKNYNQIIKLLNAFDEVVKKVSSDEEMDTEYLKYSRTLLFNLSTLFNNLISKRILKLRKSQTDEEQLVCKWMISKYNTFINQIFTLWKINKFSQSLATLKIDALEKIMQFIKYESKYLGPNIGESYFANVTYKKILKNLLCYGDLTEINGNDGTINDYLLLEFQELYFEKYWDLRFYLFQELPNILNEFDELNEETERIIFSKLLTLVKKNPVYDTNDKQNITELPLFIKNAPENTIYSVNTFNNNFEKTWINILNLKGLKEEEYKSILTILHKRIIPFFGNAQKLMDFLTLTYSIGIENNNDIILSILSLNGLWELMKSYNLEYPSFYTNLYAILTPNLLHLKEKSRFFRLLELFMSSTHLPASIVASFIKRLSRLSLTSPPSGIVIIIPFIYNLIKKYNHSTCMLLIHSTTTNEEDLKYIDPFDENEKDPSLTNAIDSSIWELNSMVNHYHPNVSALVKIFYQFFNKFSYNLEDFLDWNYNKLLETEFNKKLKGEIGLEFEKWDSMFDDNGYMEDYLY
ncbi:ribosome biosynthesis protein [Pichia kluyveri]|uniref:Ribosome biosynthesis protein n=1 Tax=Pichia kluyveri TaxID=36015 RepID=A0AAV5QXA7_PICKL|nr:ribosome biosynthesis protein [Pichia kluyveri]